MTKLTDEVQYYDREGNPTTLYKLIRSEPEWAASRIQAQADEIKVLREALDNLENDAGTIPANLWKMVTDARGRK